jgi:four helix bundle protein
MPCRFIEGGRFQNLRVYVEAAALADEVRSSIRSWDSIDLWSAGIQMLRAADSIGANVAEACGRHGWPDKTRLLFIARGSTYELQQWLERANARDLPCPQDALNRADGIGQMLNGLIKAFQQRATSNWQPVSHTGITPCFLHGRSTRFVSAISSARITVGRVSRGSMTSSIRAFPAAM